MDTNTAMPSTRVRLSLEVSAELNRRLDELATDLDTSKSDVLRKAIALMGVAADAKEHGKKLYVSDTPPEGTSQEIVGL